MNAAPNSLGLKLLTKVVPDSSAVGSVQLLHHDEPVTGEPDTIEEIHIRAETVTSVLQNILDFHPATHWGINE